MIFYVIRAFQRVLKKQNIRATQVFCIIFFSYCYLIFFFCATVGTGTGIIFESRNGVIWGGVISELCAGHRHDLTGTERGPE